MKEEETFRMELEMLRSFYPNKTLLTRKEVGDYTGRGRRWLDSHGFKGREFTVSFVANVMAEINTKN